MTTDVVFFLEPSPPHNSQRIDANTDATNNTTKTTHQHMLSHTVTYCHILTHTNTTEHHQNTTKHNTHFQHRYRPASFQVAPGLHSNTRTVLSCMMRTCSPNRNGPKPTHTDTQASQSFVSKESRLNE